MFRSYRNTSTNEAVVDFTGHALAPNEPGALLAEVTGGDVALADVAVVERAFVQAFAVGAERVPESAQNALGRRVADGAVVRTAVAGGSPETSGARLAQLVFRAVQLAVAYLFGHLNAVSCGGLNVVWCGALQANIPRSVTALAEGVAAEAEDCLCLAKE